MDYRELSPESAVEQRDVLCTVVVIYDDDTFCEAIECAEKSWENLMKIQDQDTLSSRFALYTE